MWYHLGFESLHCEIHAALMGRGSRAEHLHVVESDKVGNDWCRTQSDLGFPAKHLQVIKSEKVGHESS